MTDKLSMMSAMTHKTSHTQCMRNAHEPYYTKDKAYEQLMSAIRP